MRFASVILLFFPYFFTAVGAPKHMGLRARDFPHSLEPSFSKKSLVTTQAFPGMRVLPQHKHQKLILQCYPPGKFADKKPNPSELSYLLYYASTRRIKLEKVIDFLDSKTKRDTRALKLGNLMVTLAIVLALIEKCADNLNVFASQVVLILRLVLSVKELPLVRELVTTYGKFCSKLDGGLFSGDKDFVLAFTALTELLISTGNHQLGAVSTNKLEWKMVALLTARHAFNCLGFNARLLLRFIELCVPLLAHAVLARSSSSDLTNRLNLNLKVESEDKQPLSRVVTGKTAQRIQTAADHFDLELLTDGDLNEEALLGLRTLFSTLYSNQISEATDRVVDFNFANLDKTEKNSWGITFLEMCASWIPVQLRFVALLTLLFRLNKASEKANSKDAFPGLVHTATYVKGLVSSNFNMIGLSISDIIQHLLVLQTNLLTTLVDHLAPEQVSQLSLTYSLCVCNLSSHIYYFDQVQDSIERILMQTDSVLLTATPEKVDRVHRLVLVFLDTISDILAKLASKSSSITRNHLTLENWDLGLQLITLQKSFPEFASSASEEQVFSIEKRFLDVFNRFLDTEFPKTSGPVSQLLDESNPYKSLVPNYNEYIGNPENIIKNFLLHASGFLEGENTENGGPVTELLVLSLLTLINVTGVNFVYNFIPFFQLWQLLDNSFSARVRDTIAYVVLSAAFEVLNTQYGETLATNLEELQVYQQMKLDIEDRKKAGVWVYEVDIDCPRETVVEGHEVTSRVHKQELYDLFSKTGLGEQHAPKPGSPLPAIEEDNYVDAFEELQQPSHGFGLGKANDIQLIHSSILNAGNGYNAETGSVTQDTLTTNGSDKPAVPRVADLRNSVRMKSPAKDSFVLQKQLHTTDISQLLVSLQSDDDKYVVV